jgi:hypothetical protein
MIGRRDSFPRERIFGFSETYGGSSQSTKPFSRQGINTSMVRRDIKNATAFSFVLKLVISFFIYDLLCTFAIKGALNKKGKKFSLFPLSHYQERDCD